eukprot:gene2828-13606_t
MSLPHDLIHQVAENTMLGFDRHALQQYHNIAMSVGWEDMQ